MSPPIPAGKKPPPTTLPSELIFEILTRLPGKPVARSKIICKEWLSMIRSHPFRKAYQNRHRGLVLHWCEDIGMETPRKSLEPDLRLRFFYSPLNWPEDFSPFLQFDLDSDYDFATQVVNGLVCYGQKISKGVTELMLYNVFTGEKMKVPDPEPEYGRFEMTESTYHLGYDPETGEYKILRMIFECDREDEVANFPLQVHLLVLRPSGSESTWEFIRRKDSGLVGTRLRSKVLHELAACGHEARNFSGDGIVCWFRKKEGLILFDFCVERFRRVKFPEGLGHDKRVFVRGRFNGLFRSLALYVLPLDGNDPECFVLDDFNDGNWRKETVEFPEDVRGMQGGLAVACGEEMLLLMGNEEGKSRAVHSYGDDKSVERFLIGSLPNKPLDLDGKCKSTGWPPTFDARLSYLEDGSILYRSLDDLLTLPTVCECCGNDIDHVDEDTVAAS